MGVEPGATLLQDVRTVLLDRMPGLFFRVIPRRWKNRDSADLEVAIPRAASRSALVELRTVPVLTPARSSSLCTPDDKASTVSAVVRLAVTVEMMMTLTNIHINAMSRPPNVAGDLSP